MNQRRAAQADVRLDPRGQRPRGARADQRRSRDGAQPETMLFEALIPSLEEVGARFERGDFFVPEMLIAGRAMAGALEVLRPLLAETGVEPVGTFVMGTVKGDVHDIGKNLVNIMLEGAGFHVIDLGVQVAPERFVEAIHEHQPDIVGFSAFLTTTMPMFKANINALEKAGLRDQVIVMVGGAPGNPGVRRRGRCRRLRLGRLGCGEPGEGPPRSQSAPWPRPRAGRNPPCTPSLSSATRQVVIGDDQPFCIIGERINPTGRKIFQDQLRGGDLSRIEIDVAQQVKGGAMVLDVNMGVPLADEVELMVKAVKLVQSRCDLPLCIDSSVIEALEAGLSSLRGKGPSQLRHRRRRAPGGDTAPRKAHGAAVIALPNDEFEIPEQPERRLELARKIVEVATENYGIAKEDIVLDPLAMPIGADTSLVLRTLRRSRS